MTYASVPVALVTALLVGAGCGPGVTDRAQPAPSSSTVRVHLVRSALDVVYLEPGLLDRGEVPADLTAEVRAALEGLLILTGEERGQLVSALLPGLTSSVPPGIALLDLSIEDGLVTVDLGGELRAAGGSSLEEQTFAQQLAHTVLLDDSLTALRLLVDGEAVTELWGHLDWSVPLRADPSVLSPITIEEPGPATIFSGSDRITVRGQASVTGGTVLLRLEDDAGRIVAEASVQASDAAPGRGTWAWDVRVPGPGTWVIVAQAAASQDAPGRAPFETRRTTAYESSQGNMTSTR